MLFLVQHTVPLVEDSCGGIRESSCGGIWYVAMGNGQFDQNGIYECPVGYKRATKNEIQNKLDNMSSFCDNSQYVYRGMCGWDGYKFEEISRIFFCTKNNEACIAANKRDGEITFLDVENISSNFLHKITKIDQ